MTGDDVKDWQRLRDVGKLEQCSTARHALDYYRSVHVGATYTISEPGNGNLKSWIYRALEKVVRTHPALSVIPVDEHTANPYFARLPSSNLDDIVSFHVGDFEFKDTHIHGIKESKNFNDFVNKQHDRRWEAPKPFWRLCILQDSSDSSTFAALFFFHHSFADGESGKAFHRTLHTGLEDAISAGSTSVSSMVKSCEDPLLPNIELVAPMTVSWPFFLRRLFEHYVWAPARDPGLWTGGKALPPSKTTTRSIVFPSDATKSFISTCRSHKTTLTACLQVIVCRALFKYLPEQFTKLHFTGVISLRHLLNDQGINEDTIGVFVQDYNEMYFRDSLSTPLFPWDEATRSRDTIIKTLAMKGADTTINMLKYVPNMVNYFKAQEGKDRGRTFEISNLGLYKSKQSPSSVSIGRMFFSQCMGVTSPAFKISAITGGDGCLVLTYTSQDESVSDELMTKVIDDVSRCVLELAS